MMNPCSCWLFLIRDKDGILNFAVTHVVCFFFSKSNTQVYSWKKVAMGKKFITVKVSTKYEMGNLGLAVHCISETCSSYCIPSVISGHRYAYGKKYRKRQNSAGKP